MPGSGVQLASARVGFSVLGEPTNGLDGNLATPGGLILSWPGPSVLVTRDGARSWTRSLSAPGGFWGLDVLDRGRAWGVGVTGLYRTVDGGRRWQRAREPSKPLVRVAFTDATRGFGLTVTGRLVRSDNSGNSWRASAWRGRGVALCAPEPGVVVVADQRGGIWRTGNGGKSWRQVAAGLPQVGMLSGWHSDVSCQGSNMIELARAFCTAACGGEVDAVLRQTTDGALRWRTILTQRAGAGGVHTDPASGPSVPIDRAAAVADNGVCLVAATGIRPAVAISCRPHPGQPYRTATVPRLPFPDRHTTVAVQGLAFHGAHAGWLLLDQATAASTPSRSRAKTEIWTTSDGGPSWHRIYASHTYRGHWCSKRHTSTCWR